MIETMIRRSRVYRATFSRAPLSRARRWLLYRWRTRGEAYRRIFALADADIVLADLARYCNAGRTTFVTDNQAASALLEGRRQVWLRIESYLHMSESDMRKLVQLGAEKERA